MDWENNVRIEFWCGKERRTLWWQRR